MQHTLHSWKSLTRLSVVALSVLLSAAPAFASSGDDEGPALKSTSDWLAANLVRMSANYVKIHSPVAESAKASRKTSTVQELSKVNSTVTAASMQGCHLSITEQQITTVGNSTVTKTTIYEVPLELMKSVHLGISERPQVKGEGFVDDYMPESGRVVHVNSLKQVITYSTTTTGGPSAANGSDSGMTAVLDVMSDDSSLSQRVEKALSHAVHLCSATVKSEPF